MHRVPDHDSPYAGMACVTCDGRGKEENEEEEVQEEDRSTKGSRGAGIRPIRKQRK